MILYVRVQKVLSNNLVAGSLKVNLSEFLRLAFMAPMLEQKFSGGSSGVPFVILEVDVLKNV